MKTLVMCREPSIQLCEESVAIAIMHPEITFCEYVHCEVVTLLCDIDLLAPISL